MTVERSKRDVVMPKLGMTMQEATILEWHAQSGDRVEKGDVLFTIETEKAALDIEAPASGRLEILVPAGQTVSVKERVATLAHSRAGGLGEQSGITPEVEATVVPASPKARAVARREGVDLSDVEGTGPRGMVVVADVERRRKQEASGQRKVKASPVARRVAEEAGLKDLSVVSGSGPGGRVMREDVERALEGKQEVVEKPRDLEGRGDRQVSPLTGPRAVTAERLTASWRERPHVTLTTEADASALVSARAQLAAEYDRKISYNAFLVLLAARALKEHPNVNARLTEEGVEKLSEVNVGVAVHTDRGLLVPVVRDAGSNSLMEVDEVLRGLVQRAQEGESPPDELAGSTFTITNLGMYEIDAFTPIINPPESAILGVGRIVPKPVVADGQVVVRDTMALSLSFDHRVVDGAPAAQFLQRVKQLIERPIAVVCAR